ncbi:DsbA family protein [Mumia sp. Pv 4-285]|uniref:DsbA family protein n=1 Tax=Mumia qirimensis TaxID=3234852 RepID=UPI00351D6764
MTRTRPLRGIAAALASLLLVSCGSAAQIAGESGGETWGPEAAGLPLTDDGGVVVTAHDLDPTGSYPDDPVAVAVYVEPLCPHCGAFAADQGRLLADRLASGAITLEYRLVSFLDTGSTDRASARSVNAALCVSAAGGPVAYEAFVGALLENQQPDGLSDDDLVALAADIAGARSERCIRDEEHQELVRVLTERGVEEISGTPAVVVDGRPLDQIPTTAELRAMFGAATV